MGLILNREIKFRVWSIQDKKMFSFDEASVTGINIETYQIPLLSAAFADGKNNFVAQQYTGLKDKNDKEIYQGDVLIYESEIREHEGRSTKAGEIVWYDNFCWAFRYGDKNDVWFLNSDFDFEKCKVIGNIFENPELLK